MLYIIFFEYAIFEYSKKVFFEYANFIKVVPLPQDLSSNISLFGVYILDVAVYSLNPVILS